MSNNSKNHSKNKIKKINNKINKNTKLKYLNLNNYIISFK